MTSVLARPEDVHYDQDELAVVGFLARYPERTRQLYSINLRQWFDWCRARGVRPLAASRAHIEVWARELEEVQGKQRATVANKLNTVIGFYKMAKVDRLIDDNPAEYIRKPKVQRQTTTEALSRSELLQVLKTAEDAGALQDHALLCLLGLSGPRIGEALALNVEDLSRKGGYHTVYMRREKGNRSGLIPLPPRTSYAFDLHLGSRVSGPIFRMGPDGHRMNDRAANRIVRRTVAAAGITDKRITCHSFRHTFITMALNSGASVRDTTNGMGYADARMVSYYDHGRDDLSRHPSNLVSAYVEGC